MNTVSTPGFKARPEYPHMTSDGCDPATSEAADSSAAGYAKPYSQEPKRYSGNEGPNGFGKQPSEETDSYVGNTQLQPHSNHSSDSDRINALQWPDSLRLDPQRVEARSWNNTQTTDKPRRDTRKPGTYASKANSAKLKQMVGKLNDLNSRGRFTPKAFDRLLEENGFKNRAAILEKMKQTGFDPQKKKEALLKAGLSETQSREAIAACIAMNALRDANGEKLVGLNVALCKGSKTWGEKQNQRFRGQSNCAHDMQFCKNLNKLSENVMGRVTGKDPEARAISAIFGWGDGRKGHCVGHPMNIWDRPPGSFVRGNRLVYPVANFSSSANRKISEMGYCGVNGYLTLRTRGENMACGRA